MSSESAFVLASGVIGILLSLYLWASIPVTGIWLLGVLLGIELICEGTALGLPGVAGGCRGNVEVRPGRPVAMISAPAIAAHRGRTRGRCPGVFAPRRLKKTACKGGS